MGGAAGVSGLLCCCMMGMQKHARHPEGRIQIPSPPLPRIRLRTVRARETEEANWMCPKMADRCR